MPILFSIIVPMFNRENLIQRAINSCLTQSHNSFEVIVVDDRSTDNSVAAVKSINDNRLILIKHEFNQGVGPARNTGVANASGRWIICLDSDDELLPGALIVIEKCLNEINDEIKGIRFSCLLDDGRISPTPELSVEIWDFPAYLKWIDRVRLGLQETIPIVRKETFLTCQYPTSRALEFAYHLSFSSQYLTKTYPYTIRLYHSDAVNQISKGNLDYLLASADDQIKSIEYILSKYGDQMRMHAPASFQDMLGGLISLCLIARKKKKGISYFNAYHKSYRLSIKIIVVLVLGVISNKLLINAKLLMMRSL
jgi:glycosyltransferase involved in cell wall biosynthesis